MANVSASKKLKKFVDISLAFTPNPVTGDLAVLKDERAINNSIKNIVLTIPGEVPFQRDMGSTVTDYLFDLVDEGTAGLLMLEIRRAIAFNEPRAEDVEVFVEAQPHEHQFVVRVQYKIVGYDQVFVFDQILRPTRY
ncbi:baseplate wedge subunit [Synechococcus phage S-H34]|uniref:Baseplate wedge subunit n=1 Tax=Synechococcus phage S-H34 TaxID=2718942 RepID=A0A6G8R6B4_9CAUD|nr:baseplate wedge subunit [Synechococcus phage S-H34]QIN96926.1 baseplate wedge subunit [Synechococcus phage S-H34]